MRGRASANRSQDRSIVERQKSMLQEGFAVGKLRYKKREEPHRRGRRESSDKSPSMGVVNRFYYTRALLAIRELGSLRPH
jgi:hypothetical protein